VWCADWFFSLGQCIGALHDATVTGTDTDTAETFRLESAKQPTYSMSCRPSPPHSMPLALLLPSLNILLTCLRLQSRIPQQPESNSGRRPRLARLGLLRGEHNHPVEVAEPRRQVRAQVGLRTESRGWGSVCTAVQGGEGRVGIEDGIDSSSRRRG
jgi:hypothetical protein